MIRPLEYCLTQAHIQASIETIDARISELHTLRKQYELKQLEIAQKGNSIENECSTIAPDSWEHSMQPTTMSSHG